MTFIISGIVLWWIRRHERLYAARSHWAVGLTTSNLVFSLTYAIREYVGEASWPCITQTLSGLVSGSLIPAILIVRNLGTYSQHLRQDRLLESSHRKHGGSHEADADISLQAFAGTATTVRERRLCSLAWLDRLLLWSKFYLSRTQCVAACACSIPWVAVFLHRVATYAPSRTLTAVGCIGGPAAFIMSGIVIAVLLSILLPVYLRLLCTRDLLHLRHEVLLEVTVSPLVLVWYLYAKLTPEFEVVYVTGNYAVIAYGTLLFICSVWLPGVLSYLPSERQASESLLVGLRADDSASNAAVVAGSGSQTGTDGTRTRHGAARADSAAQTSLSAAGSLPQLRSFAQLLRSPDDVPGGSALYLTSQGLDIDAGDSLKAAILTSAAWGYITPAVSLSEARNTLEPLASSACYARSLRVVATLLLAMPSGRALLLPALAGEFCAEIATFLLQVRLRDLLHIYS
jgi:hypothetical protein